MLLNKITKTKNRFRAYPTHQAVQTSGSTAQNHLFNPIKSWVLSGVMSTVLGLTRVFKFQPSLGKLHRLIVERNAVPSQHVKF